MLSSGSTIRTLPTNGRQSFATQNYFVNGKTQPPGGMLTLLTVGVTAMWSPL